MSDSKIIAVTGISGSGTREFCRNYAQQVRDVKIYHTGDMIYQLAQSQSSPPIPQENLINLHPGIMSGLRDKAFDYIIDNLESDKAKYSRIIIDTHAQLFWNHVFTNAYDWKYLRDINPDMFISIVDKPSSIRDAQLKTERGKSQNHSLRDLLLWQNVEVNVTQGWASNHEKPMYVFSRKQSPANVESLLDNRFLIYSSFPMTDAASEETNKIVNFKAKLRNVRKEIDGREIPVIDPADIDIESDEGLDEITRRAIGTHTVHRDLNWDVDEATHVIAYYPNARMGLSKGVSDECTRARETGKFVYVICPREKISPFMDIAHKVFKSEDEFFDFFKGHARWALEHYKR
ncbi:MAG: AAA family ATPase [archaeon]